MRSTWYPLLVNGDMSAGVISGEIQLNQMAGLSIQVNWTGTPVGNLGLTASNDGIVWSLITPSVTAINGPGDIIFNVFETMYQRMRVEYQRVSGSGFLGITVSKKGP